VDYDDGIAKLIEFLSTKYELEPIYLDILISFFNANRTTRPVEIIAQIQKQDNFFDYVLKNVSTYNEEAFELLKIAAYLHRSYLSHNLIGTILDRMRGKYDEFDAAENVTFDFHGATDDATAAYIHVLIRLSVLKNSKYIKNERLITIDELLQCRIKTYLRIQGNHNESHFLNRLFKSMSLSNFYLRQHIRHLVEKNQFFFEHLDADLKADFFVKNTSAHSSDVSPNWDIYLMEVN